MWVHLRKERFPSKRKSKLMPRADGPVEVLEKVSDNAYKRDLPREYGVSCTFNVADLKPYFEDNKFENLRQKILSWNGRMTYPWEANMISQGESKQSTNRVLKSFNSRDSAGVTFWFKPENGPILLAHILSSRDGRKVLLAPT